MSTFSIGVLAASINAAAAIGGAALGYLWMPIVNIALAMTVWAVLSVKQAAEP